MEQYPASNGDDLPVSRFIDALEATSPDGEPANLWREQLTNGRTEFVSEIREAGRLVDAEDLDGLIEHTSRHAQARAAARATAIRTNAAPTHASAR